MIYDLIEMPFRKNLNGTQDTIIPFFYYDKNNVDNVEWFGRQLKISSEQLVNLFKYKTIEIIRTKLFGEVTLERCFLSPKQIDIYSDWWNLDQEIFPICGKYITHGGNAVSFKYLNGIVKAIPYFESHLDMPCTLQTKLLDLFNNEILDNDLINKKNDPKSECHCVIPSNDLKEIQIYMDSKYNCNKNNTIKKLKPYFKNITFDFLGTNISTYLYNFKSLIRTYNTQPLMHTGITMNIPGLFELDKDVKLFDNVNKDIFINILETIEDFIHTDFYVEFEYDTTKDNRCIQHNTEIRNRYFQCLYTKETGFIFFHQLATMFMLWSDAKNNNPIYFKIQKTWLEEVYIEVTNRDGSVDKYYVDLILFALGTLSIIEDL